MSEFSKYLDLAIMCSNEGNTKEAIGYLEKIVKIKPNFSTGWVMMGQEYEKLHEWKKARKCYNIALMMDSKNSDAEWFKRNLGQLIAEKGAGFFIEEPSEKEQIKEVAQKAIPIERNIRSTTSTTRMKRQMKKRYLIILGIFSLLILGGGIGQFAFVLSNRSELIWSEYDRYDFWSDTGNEIIYLPPSPHGYFLVFSANHLVVGQDVTIMDITFVHSETSYTRHYHLVVTSSLYQGWFTDSVVMNTPSGEYDASWSYSGDGAGIEIQIYKKSIFNANGDPTMFNEITITIISVIIFIITLIIGIIGFASILKQKRNSTNGNKFLKKLSKIR